MNNNPTVKVVKAKHLYRTRGGDVVWVHSIASDSQPYPVQGVVLKHGYEDSWDLSGKISSGDEQAEDIISEIPTPPIDFSRIGEVGDGGGVAL